MSLFALYKSEPPPSRQRLHDVLAGNLCRCTGYRPIIEAAAMMYHLHDAPSDAARPWMHQPYLGYRHTALGPGEFIERIRVPIHGAHHQIRAYKIAKRFDQDISAVCGAYHLVLEDRVVRDIRICYGGMAATPLRADRCERALIGNPWTEASVTAAMARLDEDYAPITDVRASEAYRRLVAKHLLRRFFLDTSVVM